MIPKKSYAGGFAVALATLPFLAEAADLFPGDKSWLDQADTMVGVVVGTVTFVTGIIAIPVAWMTISYTRHKITNMALENEKLRKELSSGHENQSAAKAGASRVLISGDRNVVHIVSDPRLAGPILILLNFCIAFVILMLFEYGKGVVIPLILYFFGVPQTQSTILFYGMTSSALPVAVGLLLLIPITRDALRVRRSLQSSLTESFQNEL